MLAAVLASLATACAVIGSRPDGGASVTVLAAARDLPGGVLAAADVRPVALRPGTAPDGALGPGTPVAGRVLTGPVRRGEPLTDVRLLGPGLLAAHRPGTVAAPVRVADPESARLLSPGDVVNVLAAQDGWDGSAPARTVAEGVPVLALPAGESGGGALIVLATTPEQAADLASAQAGGKLSITISTPR
ncbi:flagellar biosynthesis protein FlgA [Planomonospora sp. ID67723]|uniref:RcpC/CpaB family pilus assembly protein n=1 Tax=Planomonospora sp. ID67723 TaxID=2738134 RepID=UPI0018C37528|nr:RcpC/CpaB family pilus assembly protein [Planomonospora sp. ID67723]MBG0826343.1 flagellar biosynthesis protein FlgA [Planomonospora sp. ID67723]